MSAGCQTPQQVAQPDRGSPDGLHYDHFPRCISLFEVAHLVESRGRRGSSSRNGLTHCWVVSRTGQSQLKRLNPAPVPSIYFSDANMAERAFRLFCPFLGRRFVIVCTYPPYSVLSVQILRHSDPRDYTIYGLELFNEKSGHAQT